MDKILTIIIPTYNMEKYLHKCLDSLIINDEEMKHLEVLVINDGSKDSSSQIAHEYQDNYPDTFRVIDKENGNYGSCINCGLKEATGKYIKVLDADDTYCTEVLEDFVRLINGVDVDMFVSPFDIVNEKGEITRTHTFDLVPDRTCILDDFLESKMLNLEMHAVTYRRSIFLDLDYHQTEGISYTDQEWVFTPITQVVTFYYYNKCIYKYLVGREGQTVSSAVAKKSINHRIIGGATMLKEYNSFINSISVVKRNYLYNKLFARIESIYLHTIVYHNDCKQLIEFDNLLCETNYEIWNRVNSLSFGCLKWKYAKDWRSNNYRIKRPIYIRVYFAIHSLMQIL